MTDAIQQDVSKSPEQVKEEQEKIIAEARQATIKERVGEVQDLAEMHKARREAELAEQGTGEDEQVSIDSGDDEGQKTGQATETKQEKTSEKVDTGQVSDETMRKLMIDGKEIDVPQSKIDDAGVRALQKEYTADARLEEATRILKEAQKVSAQPKESQPSQDVDDTASESIDKEALAKSLVDGNVDEVAEAIGKIMGTGRQTELATQAINMQPNDVYGMVESALQLKDAMDTFQRDPEQGGYGDLYADETMRQMVFDKETALAQGEDPKPPAERLKQAATEVREWRDSLIKQSGGQVVNFDSRADKKAQADSTPKSAGGRPSAETPDQPKSKADKRREVLYNMARSRGQNID